MQRLVLFFLIVILSGCSNNNMLLLSSNDDLGQENTSLFTLRNIQSGFMLYNGLDQQGRETLGWSLVEVETPIEASLVDQSGWIMFQSPGTNQCLGSPDGRVLIKMPCNSSGNKTIFTLITSTTGAVQIKSIPSGMCILDSSNSGLSFPLGKCINDIQKLYEVIPQRNLWMLNPPNLESPVF